MSLRMLSARPRAKAAPCRNWLKQRYATAPLPMKAGEDRRPCRHSAAAAHWSTLPIAKPSAKPWKAGSARGRHQCAGLRRRRRLAISCLLPRLTPAPASATGCLVPDPGDILRVSARHDASAGHAAAVERQRGVAIRDGTTRLASPFSSRKRMECGRLRNVFYLIKGSNLVAVLFNHVLRRSDFYNFSVFQDGAARTELGNQPERVTCKN
jgi:hypothetical protein